MSLRRTPLAVLNLLNQPVRTAVSVTGVTFALVLVFMQLGFLGAVGHTATIVLDRLEFDLLIRSPEYLHLYEAGLVDQNVLQLLRGHPQIEQVSPFYIMLQRWQSLGDDQLFQGIAVMGMRLDRPVFDVPEIRAQLASLTRSDAVLIDRATRADFGPADGVRFGDQDIGRSTILGQQRVQLVGHFRVGTGLATNGALLMSEATFDRITPVDVRQHASLGLARLKPGVDPDQAAEQIRAWLATRLQRSVPPVEVLSRNEAVQWERHRWIRQTPIGLIFQMGTALAFVVGAGIVYMVLATDVTNRLPEYATLKAMGYSGSYLRRVVLAQAWWFALLGFIPGSLLALALYEIVGWLSGIEVTMTVSRLGWVALLAVGMCTLSGLGALRQLNRAEPAALF